MSDENLWGEEEPFNDMPDEAQLDDNGRPKVSPPVQLQRPKAPKQAPAPAPVVEDVQEEVPESEEEQEDFSDVLTDASLRLEQGNLYKLIMNHSLFDGTEADPKAVQNVQREIRKFAKDRMEIMLGMRRETATVERLEIDFPFNSLEVDILKKLAFAATKGASEHSDKFVPEITKTTEEVPRVGKATLNPIGSSAAHKKAPQKIQSKPLPRKATAPVKRTKLDLTIDQIAREEGIPRELLEENEVGVGGKPIHEMTENEILERNKIAGSRRNTQVRSSKAMPMPSFEQQQMMAVERANQIGTSTPLMAKILDAVKKMPTK